MQKKAPHAGQYYYHKDDTNSAPKKMGYLALALVPIYLTGFFYYGPRVLLTGIVAVLVSLLFDSVCYRIRGMQRLRGDYSAAITALILVLLLPASVPFIVVITGCFIAICIAKHPFGGFGKNMFNPAAVGFCFVAICWPGDVLRYPKPFTPIAFDGSADALVGSISQSLSQHSTPNISSFDILLGQFAGPIAATSVLVLAACFLFLAATKTINWKIPLFCVATCAVIAFAFPRVDMPRIYSVFYELTSGVILFGSVFMATDPVNLPKNKASQILFAFLLGVATMLFRYFGHYELGFCFALVILNSIAASLDVVSDRIIDLLDKSEKETKRVLRKGREMARPKGKHSGEQAQRAVEKPLNTPEYPGTHDTKRQEAQ